jgi:hypothetical protein
MSKLNTIIILNVNEYLQNLLIIFNVILIYITIINLVEKISFETAA